MIVKSMNNKNKQSELLFRLWVKVNLRRRRQFIIILFLMLIGAFTEVISLGAVLPFIGVLVDPELLFNHPLIIPINNLFGILMVIYLSSLLQIFWESSFSSLTFLFFITFLFLIIMFSYL